MADVSVRPARPEDAERVARVQLSTWKSAYGNLLPAEALDLPLVEVAAVWLNAIESPPSASHRVLVCLEQQEVVGFAASEPVTTDELDPGRAIELSALLVEPRWGGRGHGSRVLAACVDLWRADGFGLAVTWAFEADTTMTAFLESAGWGFDGVGRGLDTGPRVVHQRRLHTDLQPLA